MRRAMWREGPGAAAISPSCRQSPAPGLLLPVFPALQGFGRLGGLAGGRKEHRLVFRAAGVAAMVRLPCGLPLARWRA